MIVVVKELWKWVWKDVKNYFWIKTRNFSSNIFSEICDLLMKIIKFRCQQFVFL